MHFLKAQDIMNSEQAPSVQQRAGLPSTQIDTGLACLCMLARFHGIAVNPEQLIHEFSVNGRALSIETIVLAAKKLGLMARIAKPNPHRLKTTPLPAIAQDKEGKFFILGRVENNTPHEDAEKSPTWAKNRSSQMVIIQDPFNERPEKLEMPDFENRWNGHLILLASRASAMEELAKFDFSWFIPAIIKYRHLLGEVLLVSLVLQLFALVTPLFFQVVMDKVLVHRSFSTLDVITIGLLVVTLFEVGLSALRTYVFAHTTSRIDVELGTRLFQHLLSLPLAYFHQRRVGDSIARVRELESIRSFLTSNAITVVLDLAFSIIFILVMLYYSPLLTLIVVISLPCYFFLSLFFTPSLRMRLNEKFNRSAENQSFLVETISGIDTVKSMSVEPQWFRKWNHQLAAYVTSGLRTTAISNWASNGVTLVGKLVTVATMWFGAKLVIEGKITVGQLIAFNMLSGHVSTPVMRLAQLWTDFQQIGISMQRLGDILNTPTEKGNSKNPLPRLQGHLTLEQVTFRYRPGAREILRNINLTIAAGEVIGIVGRSGSGKSTLTKLLQNLYVPESGRVLVDGIDLSIADSTSLRRQMGVVLQENVLFNRSVRDNIALADPGAPLELVMHAARLAGAHEFISELPEAYDTIIGEHGTGLSGGQRQRIAIARALMHNPRILIFDEATSALDYESESIIQQNMKAICQGRTVLIIAHRLSAVRDANRIVVMERGQIIEQGRHEVLLNIPNGTYAHLFRIQQR